MDRVHTDSLRLEHIRLSGLLTELKRAEVNGGPPTWQSLCDICIRLCVGLSAHMQHEERLLGLPRRSPRPEASNAVLVSCCDHFNDYRFLQVIMRHIVSETRPFLLNSRYQLLKDFLQGLQRHMEEQEAEIFPACVPEPVYEGATVCSR